MLFEKLQGDTGKHKSRFYDKICTSTLRIFQCTNWERLSNTKYLAISCTQKSTHLGGLHHLIWIRLGTDFNNHVGLLWNLIALGIRFEADQKSDFSVIETNIIGFIFESEFDVIESDVIVVLSEIIRSADCCHICSFFYFLFC